VGDLTWQPEADRNSNDASLAIKEFFAAVEAGEKEKWLLEFFDMGGRKIQLEQIQSDGTRSVSEVKDNFYLTADIATIVTDIFSRFENREGHSVYRCPECERMYIQSEYGSNEYACYEKREA
jgi:hypothetical protein